MALSDATVTNATVIIDQVEESKLEIAEGSPFIIPKKRFTCFKARSNLLKNDSVPEAFGLFAKIPAW